MDKELLKIREKCEASLKDYAKWVCPDRYWGDVHYDLFDFFQYGEELCKLALIPRDHQKSFCAAVAATWYIAKFPWIRINYVSWSEDLVSAQMTTIEGILYSEQFRLLWPEHLNFERDPKGGMRHKAKEQWNKKNFCIDHPDRTKRMVRDPTVRATTAKSGNTGMHSDITIFDDLVTDENWDTEAGKSEVLKCYKNFAKINSTGGKFLAVGTKYSEDDLYTKMMEIEYRVQDKIKKRWKVFSRVVEDSYRRTGDGLFLWPKQIMPNGEAYGFDEEELAIKKADALIDGDLGLFYGQYYNDPRDDATNVISQDCFKYLEPRFLKQDGNTWFYREKPLKLFAGADLAWSSGVGREAKRRDFTAVSVVGIDDEGYIYVLALDRFKTDKPETYYERIVELHDYWKFSKIVVETNAAGKIIKNFIEDQVRREGGRLEVEGKSHVSHEGKKEERVANALHSRYRSGTIFHTKGGFTKLLEEEVKSAKPPHDDLKDVLALTIEQCVAPLKRASKYKKTRANVVPLHSRFGGTRGRRR